MTQQRAQLWLTSLTLLVFLGIGFGQSKLIQIIEDNEEIFHNKTIEQEEFLSRIYSNIGFGGAIHNFKNSILRRDTSALKQAKKQFSETLLILKNFSTKFPEHHTNQSNFKKVIMQYMNKIELIEEEIFKSSSITQIDSLAKIDDTPALLAIQGIRSDFSIEKVAYYNQLKKNRFSIKLFFLLAFILGSTLIIGLIYFYTRSVQKVTTQKLILTKKKEEFVRRMAHEIRTPLNAILGFQPTLSKENLSAEGAQALESIQITSNYLNTLVNDILDFSKLQANKLSLNSFPIDERNLWRKIDLVAKGIKKKSQIFTLDLIGDFGTISIDEVRIKQVVLNLLSNSFKFTKENGEILLSVTRTQDSLIIKVIDNGIGMSTSDSQSIFDEFHQSTNKLPSSQLGTGLGMTISRSILTLMKGSIEVESILGEGTKITVILPIENTTLEASYRQEEEEVPNDFENGHLKEYKILVVEDNDINQKLMKRYFEKVMITNQVDFASDGLEAINKVLKKNYDIIFMDYHMPNLDGVEATKEIRKASIEQPIIIGLSANMESRDECIEAGMNEFLSKPIKKSQIIELLTSYQIKSK